MIVEEADRPPKQLGRPNLQREVGPSAEVTETRSDGLLVGEPAGLDRRSIGLHHHPTTQARAGHLDPMPPDPRFAVVGMIAAPGLGVETAEAQDLCDGLAVTSRR